MDVARWFQCQRAISQFGFLAKHPTTGAAIASPYVAMSREFSKQMNANWYQIYQVVRDNCSVEYGSTAPHEDDFMENRILTLGSLFDGSGGFPLGGLLSGIKPLWASEIEPFPIRVTTRRFPEMKHLEDIAGIKGSEIDPVDIITFGSPCVDMSIAGKREGLNASRSGLFFQAVRIVREMREATEGKNPRFVVWENVTGAFSSNKGADFREVIQEIVNVRYKNVSVPLSEKWHTGGLIVEDDFSLAWRVFDAQYWGVPQRRKRIYLVVDLTGGCSGKILFESEGLSGNTAQSFFQGKTASPGSFESSDESGTCIAVEKHEADSRVKLSDGNKVQTLTSWM